MPGSGLWAATAAAASAGVAGDAPALDDVVDYTEEVADYLGLYKIEAPMSQAQELAKVLHQCGRQIAAAMPRHGDPPLREKNRYHPAPIPPETSRSARRSGTTQHCSGRH